MRLLRAFGLVLTCLAIAGASWAQISRPSPGFRSGLRVLGVPTGGGSTTTWDTTYNYGSAGPFVHFSNGNLTFTVDDTYRSARSTSTFFGTTQYFEITAGSGSDISVVNSSCDLTGSIYSSPNGLLFSTNGHRYQNTSDLGTWGSGTGYSPGAIVRLRIDVPAATAYISINGGSEAGPYALGFSGPVYAAVTLSAATSVTADFTGLP